MTRSSAVRTGLLLIAPLLSASVVAAQGAGPAWWQRGQHTWVYKDDWNGAKYVRGGGKLSKTFQLDAPATEAVIQLWASGSVTLSVNGQAVPPPAERTPIQDYDIASLLKVGANTIELAGATECIAEVGIALTDGKELLLLTDESWASGGNVQANTQRQGGPRGYSGDYHVGRPVGVTRLQKAKLLINELNFSRRDLLDRKRIELSRVRVPGDLLSGRQDAPDALAWAQIVALLDQARTVIDAATAQVLAGQVDAAMKTLDPASEKTRQAEQVYADRLAACNAAWEARAGGLGGEGNATFNRSAYNRLGWVASTEPMDNDPLYWEFDVAPAQVPTLGLAGMWRFRIDPNDKGRQSGYDQPGFPDADWQFVYAPSRWGWERWGVTQPGPVGRNKPYNGLGWYRQRLVVPASWAGHDLVLRLGERWSDRDWLAVNGQFVNDPSGPGNASGRFVIPAEMIRFGQPNTFAVRVLDNDNIGGIYNPPVSLSVAGAEPQDVRSPVGPASVREQTFTTSAGKVIQTLYSSALSPAVHVSTTGRSLRIAGWAQRGWEAPDRCAFVRDGQILTRAVQAGERIDPAELGENWLLLWSTGQAINTPRPLLVVLVDRPAAIEWTDDADDPAGLRLSYARAGARVAMVRPFDPAWGEVDLKFLNPVAGRAFRPTDQAPEAPEIELCRLWSRAVLKYPVGYAETLAFQGDACQVQMRYEYVTIADDWGTEPLAMAPLPMLASYAQEHRWPDLRVDGELADLGNRATGGFYPQADCGTYKAVVGAQSIAYRFAQREPALQLKGIGTWSELRPLGEKLFADLKDWGFDHSRPQIGFSAQTWGSFKQDGDGQWQWVPAPGTLEFLDAMMEWHRKRDLMCVLNWFIDTGHGGWTEVTEARAHALWAALASRYKDLPPGTICYDLINEPAGMSWEVYDPAVKRLTETIRSIDKVHPISVEFGGGWAQPEDADMTVPTGDPNTIYQYHFYGPHKEEFRDNPLYPRYSDGEGRWESYEGWEERMLAPIRFAIRHQAHVYHGEFGISHLQPDGGAEAWLEDVLAIHEKYRMGWNWWHYGRTGTFRTGLVDGERLNPLLPILQKYARMNPPAVMHQNQGR